MGFGGEDICGRDEEGMFKGDGCGYFPSSAGWVSRVIRSGVTAPATNTGYYAPSPDDKQLFH